MLVMVTILSLGSAAVQFLLCKRMHMMVNYRFYAQKWTHKRGECNNWYESDRSVYDTSTDAAVSMAQLRLNAFVVSSGTSPGNAPIDHCKYYRLYCPKTWLADLTLSPETM